MTPRYNLRTLLILLAVLPPLLWVGWGTFDAWRAEMERQRALQQLLIDVDVVKPVIVAPLIIDELELKPQTKPPVKLPQ